MPSQDITLTASDGYSLAATLYTPEQPAPGATQFIVIGCATAVPRGFYKRFCEYVASCGLHALVADYRGIGGSKQGSLKGFQMEYADWSSKDLAAVVAYAVERGQVYLVGHSLGGHALGQLPNAQAVRAAYFVATGAGWYGWMKRSEGIKVWVLWNLVAPILAKLWGYHPMSKLGLGEDLPLGVYRDWKYWCSFPRYFFDDPLPRGKAIAEKFKDIRIPIAACVSQDDLWAPPASRDAFITGYVNAAVEYIDIHPEQLGLPQIGHMGYFRKETGAALWPQIIRWLGQHGLRTT
jgi:predicted alpha/beta hydrolase